MSNKELVRGPALVVDDDPDFRSQMELLLEQLGYGTVTASSRSEGLVLARQTSPKVAFIDLMMERMDSGFGLAHDLKRSNPELPVVLVTNVARETGFVVRSGSEWLCADAVLAKPVARDTLATALSRLVP